MTTRMRSTEGYGGQPSRRRKAWSIDNRGNRAARAELIDAIRRLLESEIHGTGPLLDCGCGTGWLLEELAGAGVEPGRLHGVDADPVRVKAARRRVPGATVEAADARRLPFADDAFDAVLYVVSLSSMGPSAAVRAALIEGRRVLAPGGALVIYEPRIPNPLNHATRRVTQADLTGAGIAPSESRTITLLPPLGRRLGRFTSTAHPLLSRVPWLRSHELVLHRERART